MDQISVFLLNHWALAVALMAIVALLVMNEFQTRLQGYHQVKPQEAVRLMNQQDAFILDVSDDREYRDRHILHARHIPLGLLAGRLKEVEEYRTKPLIVYCRTGERSARAASLLRKQGYQQVYKLSGGILAWTGADLPVTKN